MSGNKNNGCPHPFNRLRASETFPDKWVNCADCGDAWIIDRLACVPRDGYPGVPGWGRRLNLILKARTGQGGVTDAPLQSQLPEGVSLIDDVEQHFPSNWVEDEIKAA